MERLRTVSPHRHPDRLRDCPLQAVGRPLASRCGGACGDRPPPSQRPSGGSSWRMTPSASYRPSPDRPATVIVVDPVIDPPQHHTDRALTPWRTVPPTLASDPSDVGDRPGMVAPNAGTEVHSDIGGHYGAEMAKKPPPRQRRTSTADPFFDLLDQMEALTITVELDWPDDIRADAQRRLNRLVRALRHAPETRGRFDV